MNKEQGTEECESEITRYGSVRKLYSLRNPPFIFMIYF